VEDQREAKEAALLFNALTAGQWFRVTKPKNLLAAYHLLSLSLQKSLGKKAHSWLLGWTPNTTVYHAQCIVVSLRCAQKVNVTQNTDVKDIKHFLLSLFL
jgi:hypothetical protein